MATSFFPDGRHVVYTSERWPAPPSVEGEANLNQLEWHADDIRFVLDELSRSNDTSVSHLPIAGRLDLARVGAFGHSLGGIAAAHACQKDQRIKACLNQDGAVGMRPFYLDARGWGMDQAFMLIERTPRTDPPSDKELAEMKLTRERANEIHSRLSEYRDRVLRSTGIGSYRVLLQRATTTHMDFSDLPPMTNCCGALKRCPAPCRRVWSNLAPSTAANRCSALQSKRSPRKWTPRSAKNS